jgi:hypothetical protein
MLFVILNECFRVIPISRIPFYIDKQSDVPAIFYSMHLYPEVMTLIKCTMPIMPIMMLKPVMNCLVIAFDPEGMQRQEQTRRSAGHSSESNPSGRLRYKQPMRTC